MNNNFMNNGSYQDYTNSRHASEKIIYDLSAVLSDSRNKIMGINKCNLKNFV